MPGRRAAPARGIWRKALDGRRWPPHPAPPSSPHARANQSARESRPSIFLAYGPTIRVVPISAIFPSFNTTLTPCSGAVRSGEMSVTFSMTTAWSATRCACANPPMPNNTGSRANSCCRHSCSNLPPVFRQTALSCGESPPRPHLGIYDPSLWNVLGILPLVRLFWAPKQVANRPQCGEDAPYCSCPRPHPPHPRASLRD